MNLTQIREILSENEIQLTKSLGQSFMHDGNQIRRIVETAGICRDDKVLEIGPGLGPLTELLVERAEKVLAIETDLRLIDSLRKKFEAAKNFEILHADALVMLQREQRDWSAWKVVANLPYSVASPILVEFAKIANGPKLITTTLQLEVAERVTAKPGTKAYGILTLLLRPAYEANLEFVIPPTCFYPKPKVDSACITLRRRENPIISGEALRVFERIVKRGFSQRRKMMMKLLKQDWPPDRLENAYQAAGLNPKIRAEAVSIEQYAIMTDVISRP